MRIATTILALCLALAVGSARADDATAVAEQFSLTQSVSEWSNTMQEVLLNALSLTGVKYKYGGKSPETGFDCSGFVRYVFQQATNLTLPHGARAISQLGQAIPIDQLLKSAFSHVGIYLGDGRFIHARPAAAASRWST